MIVLPSVTITVLW